jgi:DNA-binding beta-propeller fold protein YncE
MAGWLLAFILLIFNDNPDSLSYHPTTFVFPTYRHTYGIRKAGPTELFLFMSFKVKFRDPQGLACVRLDSWEDPDDPHDDDELTVYGVNSGQDNIIYNKSMWGLGVYGLHEKGLRRLKEPHGICANSRGDVYVADSGNNRLVRLFNPAHELQFVTAIGGPGSEPGYFKHPLQAALDSHGNVYVSDSGNNRIQVFDKENRFCYAFDAGGCLITPNGIAATDLDEKYKQYSGGENFLVVIDSADQRINKFDLQGKLLRTIRCRDFGYSQARLEYVCLDYYNQVLITDLQNNCIHKLDHDLNYIISFGRAGDEDFEFNEPRGITIYRRFGQLFVAEKSGAQYYWIGTDLQDLSVNSQNDVTSLSFKVSEPSYVSIDVLDRDGRFVKRILDNKLLYPVTRHHFSWDGRMGKGLPRFFEQLKYTQSTLTEYAKKVPAGAYRFRLNAEPTYSSRTYFSRQADLGFMRQAE